MLVSEAGAGCGTIGGGGAIEGHAITKARTMVGEDTCLVEDLALRPQAENSIGMVCGGDAVLLYVPICAEDDALGPGGKPVAEVLRAAHPCVSCIGVP